MRLWKCLDDKKRSMMGDLPPWELGVWRRHDGPVQVYKSGFHASKNIIDAMYNFGNINYICSVDVRGDRDFDDYLEAWSEMRILQAWKWKKEDSVALAIYAADLVYDIFEEACPLDGRPWKAIFAAKLWLRNPTEENRQDAFEAAKAAAEIRWIAESEFDKKYEPALYAAIAAQYAARAAAACDAVLAVKAALEAIGAVEMTFTKLYHVDTREQFEKLRQEIRKKFHEFCIIRIKY